MVCVPGPTQASTGPLTLGSFGRPGSHLTALHAARCSIWLSSGALRKANTIRTPAGSMLIHYRSSYQVFSGQDVFHSEHGVFPGPDVHDVVVWLARVCLESEYPQCRNGTLLQALCFCHAAWTSHASDQSLPCNDLGNLFVRDPCGQSNDLQRVLSQSIARRSDFDGGSAAEI